MQREARELSRFLLKPILQVTLVVASPFLAAAFLFLLLERGLLWVLVPLAMGVAILAAGLVVWAIVRARLMALAKGVEAVAEFGLGPPRT